MTSKTMLFSLSVFFIIFSLSSTSSAFFGAKFEPADGKIYHCAQAEVRPASISSYRVDWDGIEEYTKASGSRPKMIMHYITLDPPGFSLLKPALVEISRQAHDYVAQVGLDFYGHRRENDTSARRDITSEIAQGEYDATIREFAQLLGKMKIPIFLRPGFEFGGNGFGQYASKKYWADAWKRIFDIFKNEGVENVVFVWNTLDAEDFIEYYPGDEYVDWWAIDVFNNDADKDDFIDTFVKEAARHKKPVIIAESTPRYIGSEKGEKSWNTWYGPYFKLLSKYQDIKAFCYINASWKNHWNKTFKYDCRIQSDKYVTEHFSKVLSDSKFIHSDTPK